MRLTYFLLISIAGWCGIDVILFVLLWCFFTDYLIWPITPTKTSTASWDGLLDSESCFWCLLHWESSSMNCFSEPWSFDFRPKIPFWVSWAISLLMAWRYCTSLWNKIVKSRKINEWRQKKQCQRAHFTYF